MWQRYLTFRGNMAITRKWCGELSAKWNTAVQVRLRTELRVFFTISLHKIWGTYGGFWMLFIECCWVPPWTFPLSDDTRSKGMALSICTKSGIVPYHPRPYVIRLKDTSQTKHEKTDSVALHKQIPYGFSPYFKISVVLANLRNEHTSQAP